MSCVVDVACVFLLSGWAGIQVSGPHILRGGMPQGESHEDMQRIPSHSLQMPNFLNWQEADGTVRENSPGRPQHGKHACVCVCM